MILFSDSISIEGLTINDSLAYVYNCNIDNTRVKMSCMVQFILLVNVATETPNYTPYYQIEYVEVPYNQGSSLSPAAQAYNWLMTLPEYEGGSDYPPVTIN